MKKKTGKSSAPKPLCDEHGGVFAGKRKPVQCSVPGCKYRSVYVEASGKALLADEFIQHVFGCMEVSGCACPVKTYPADKIAPGRTTISTTIARRLGAPVFTKWACPNCGHSWWNHGPSSGLGAGCALCECGGARPPEPDFTEMARRVLAADGGAELGSAVHASLAEKYGPPIPASVRDELERHGAAFRALNGETESPTSSYPEHDKLTLVRDQSQKCGEFLEWLRERYVIGKYHRHDECVVRGENACGMSANTLYPASVNVRRLLAEFFEIDEEKLEAEKLAMLAEMQKKGKP